MPGPSARSRMRIALSAVCLAAAAAAFWYVTSTPPPDAPPPERVAVVEAEPEAPPVEEEEVSAREAPRLVVGEVDGRVEIRRGGAGPWTAAVAGDVLDPADAVRTASGASADLVAGDHVVHLLPATDVRIEELTADLSRFLLGTGMVAAEARGGDDARRLQIDVEGTDVTARAEQGRFRISSAKDGTVAVGAQDGRVQVAARGREVVLRAGEGTLVARGQAPADPEPLPESLLLRVAWPDETETNRTGLTVAGRTSAGALVFVAGRPVEVDATGRFETEVRLRDGRNRVRVEGHDVAGNRVSRQSPTIVVDTRGAAARFDTDDLWGD
jgi:hypothetical protein